jgi:hypothetical protein
MKTDNHERRAKEVLDEIVELTYGLPNNIRDAVFELVKIYGKTYSPLIPQVIALLIAPE